jgi:uncharacterized protein (DUF885 family)
LACQELERYTFLAPGQATAYFAGAMALTELRAEVELLQGEGFTRRGFHDLLFAQGFGLALALACDIDLEALSDEPVALLPDAG